MKAIIALLTIVLNIKHGEDGYTKYVSFIAMLGVKVRERKPVVGMGSGIPSYPFDQIVQESLNHR